MNMAPQGSRVAAPAGRGSSDAPVHESLKNLDPKLVEFISNEVRQRFRL